MILLPHAKRIATPPGAAWVCPACTAGFSILRVACETRVCTKCGEEKPITTFKSSSKCGACRYQEQLMRDAVMTVFEFVVPAEVE